MKRHYGRKVYKEWRDQIYDHDGGTCAITGCDKTAYLNAHHIIPSSFSKYEFDPLNGIMLCPLHHTLGKWSAHKNPLWFTHWLHIHHFDLWELAMTRLEEMKANEV